jgi:uncharacterized RDD family membrane protein YckC
VAWTGEPKMDGVSEIPVGSPPAPPGRHAAPGGWYPDPANAAQERYWDGWQWSRNIRPRDHALPGQWAEPRGHPQDRRTGDYPPAVRRSQAPRTADGVPLAGWWWRVLSSVIDGLILATVSAIVLAPIYLRLVREMSDAFAAVVRAAQAGQPQPQLNAGDLLSVDDQLAITSVTLALQMIYLVTFLRWKAATPGQLVCGLKVVPLDVGHSHSPLPWPVILLRSAIWVLPGALGVLVVFKLIDALFPLWHPKRQTLHDLAAHTQVVFLR